jgi:hypothetical protein
LALGGSAATFEGHDQQVPDIGAHRGQPNGAFQKSGGFLVFGAFQAVEGLLDQQVGIHSTGMMRAAVEKGNGNPCSQFAGHLQ